MVYQLTLSYCGTSYAGWQRQANALSIQEVVETALGEVLGQEARIQGASRTDKGVHARGQVAHLVLEHDFPMSGLVHGTNQRLPGDIRVLQAKQAGDDFHARKSATAKEYRYRLIRADILSPLDARFGVRIDPRIDLEAAKEASLSLLGEHDFSAFARSGGSHFNPRRSIYAVDWSDGRDTGCGEEVELRVVGSGFLRGMVRCIVGTLLEIGYSQRPAESLGRLLAGGERSAAGPTAPAHGLSLHRVIYTSDQ
jgi:tRNA pseudouridine38-40 synthase